MFETALTCLWLFWSPLLAYAEQQAALLNPCPGVQRTAAGAAPLGRATWPDDLAACAAAFLEKRHV